MDAVGGGLAVDKRRAHSTLKQNAAQDRAYIESCFGPVSYTHLDVYKRQGMHSSGT